MERLEKLLASLKDGDVRRGQAVFNGTKASCSACHAIGYLGGNIGPDLTHIGKIRNERDLLESIVFPSASLVRSYEPVQVTTKTGKVYNGLVRKDAPDEVVLATGANRGSAHRPQRHRGGAAEQGIGDAGGTRSATDGARTGGPGGVFEGVQVKINSRQQSGEHLALRHQWHGPALAIGYVRVVWIDAEQMIDGTQHIFRRDGMLLGEGGDAVGGAEDGAGRMPPPANRPQ